MNAPIQNVIDKSRSAKGLLRENQELRARSRANQLQTPTEQTAAEDETAPNIQSPSDPSHNPLLEEKPWFLPIKSSNLPILIGEVADAAFATRFRQLLTNDTLNHIPRISYPGYDQITELAQTECPRPSPTHARFLFRVALKSLDESFHIVRNSRVWELLEQSLQAPQSVDLLSDCKLTALLALGELYSSRCQTQETKTPGLAYFSHASKAYGLLQERPCIDSVEISLLLCLYALCINRRHSAYFLASSAVRHCVVMGLHFNLPDTQLRDPETREHLSRIWWTAYIMDHTSASISSQIVSIPDDEIFVDLPSSTPVPGMRQADFKHPEWLMARIGLVKVTRKMIKSVYGRSQEKESFLQRVQHALQNLKQWLETLPTDIQMDSQSSHSKPAAVQSLHLSFNQSMILATRPVLLHMLRMHKESNGDTPATPDQIISGNVQALGEACIRCARHSYATIVESWIEGSFRTFDYFNTQYLFSAATILAISGLVGGSQSSKDREDFDFAGQLLEKLRDSGSFAAMEFCRHIEAMKADIQGFLRDEHPPVDNVAEPDAVNAPEGSYQPEITSHSVQLMTSGMALAEPSLEAFLQSEQSLSQVDFFLDDVQLEGLYWPTHDTL
ncbi:fungal-specific transcription factor domain-containing protein [Dactylonectria estremocensis]|uniref:Fungal-specific transcription factor domain-containing protein n=1 Tax=Dactylonectria estremocensis TaxID=1079267 RepID=A0A9P9IIK8_9HYPO|nr:fungal-specific transcription factor domain-containing protein [Dactylonectria estremocensis]